MGVQRLCAYNQTRECFLGLEVAAADLSYNALKDKLGKLALQSGEGLWMMPFRGIPETEIRVPLDLIYLSEDCKVIETVESFPTFRVTASSPKATSVLALPAHSIYSSQTQQGDQLVLCVAEEMQHLLERFSTPGNLADGVQSAVLLREKPLWSGGPGVVELEDSSGKDRPNIPKPYEMEIAEAEEEVEPPKSWLQRWFSPDRKTPELKRAPREHMPRLAAYYWTGDAPKPHSIRDISSSGLYVVTEERWYPGTLILMTLQEKDNGEKITEHSISVHSRAVRWGNDGVGLQFIPQDAPGVQKGLESLPNGAKRKDLERFLKRLTQGKQDKE